MAKTKKVTTVEMEALLMQYFNIRVNIIVPNVCWGMFYDLHECDLLVLSKASYASEVEIKISKADLLKDKEKPHGHYSDYIKNLWFAVPVKLEELALTEIPERAGLIAIDNAPERLWHQKVKVLRKPKPNKYAKKWREIDRAKLLRLGCMRILGLKKKIVKLQNDSNK